MHIDLSGRTALITGSPDGIGFAAARALADAGADVVISGRRAEGARPPLIECATFDAVQALKARNQKTVLPHRVVIGPTMLTGICFCGNCGGAMTIRTGKGGRYRYYACSIKARQGETGCKGRAIPMDKLDQLVAGHIEERVLDPERLEEMLETILGRGGYQRDHLRALAQRVEVGDDEVRIMGSKSDLLRTLVAAQGGKSAGIGVPSRGPKWRATPDDDEHYVYAVALL